MNKKRKKLPSTIYKTAIVLVGGALVALAFMANIDTSSWFTSQVQHEIKVTAATTEDIIEKFDVVENKDGSLEIIVKKKEGLDYNPTIFFSVEGEVKDYILNINPVTLKDNECSIPIKLNINNMQYINTSSKRKNHSIKGTIRLKYLNNYIDEEKEISFPREYLDSEYWDAFPNRGNNKDIVDLIEQMAQHVDWQNEESQPKKLEFKAAIADLNNINSTESVSENVMPSINKIMLSPYQSQIIDVIAPRLMPHVENLYNTIENLAMTLNEKISEIESLNLVIEEREAQIVALNEEKVTLENDNTALTENIQSLEDTNAKLNENIEDLNETLKKSNEKIDSLSDSNSNLKNKNSSLSQKLNDLTDENTELNEKIEVLEQKILELTTEEDNDKTVPEEVYDN